MEASTLGALSDSVVLAGGLDDAVSMLRESLRLHREVGDVLDTAVDLCRFAGVIAGAHPETAARLLASTEALGDDLGGRRSWVAEMTAATLAKIRAELDEAAIAEAWTRGRSLTLDDAVELALECGD